MEFGHREQAVVIGDGADYDDDLVSVGRVFGVGAGDVDDAGDGHWGTVDPGHEEAAEDYFVEVGVGAACGKKKGQLEIEAIGVVVCSVGVSKIALREHV